MLKLTDIKKDYVTGDTTVNALKGVNIEFRKSEFVSILGPSGCGKTTLLNIIGGLDRYTSGDLSVNGRSTKNFEESDWDSYRNHSIGFVFQSYNLIPHQTVLANVELALTLSGVSKKVRRKKAIEALRKVGLGDQIKKKPNQLSGGQMQRVAIARALVNDPEILLADEPTGALDSDTSVQIMEILKEISGEKLIIMVTHNPELARQYSTRIITLLDGEITGDTNPWDGREEPVAAKPSVQQTAKKKKKAEKKPRMSFFTALSLSLNNLRTKKARTFMTSFAGSIGIIGIALIMGLSNGIQLYINRVQEDTLSSYPLIIESESADLTSLMESIAGIAEEKEVHDDDMIYSNPIMMDMMNAMVAEMSANNLRSFKEYIESKDSGMADYTTTIKYGYNMDLNIYASDTSDDIIQVNPSKMMETIYGEDFANSYSSMSGGSAYMQVNVWDELIGNQKLLSSQYDVIAGDWPKNYDEVVLVVDSNNEINDMILYSLGLKNPDELKDIMSAITKGETFETSIESYSFDEILDTTFKLVLPADYYEYDSATGTYVDMSEDERYLKNLINDGVEIKISGIIRPNENAVSTSVTGAIGYTSDLTEYVINETNKKSIVKKQKNNQEVDIFTGLSFDNSNSDYQLTIDDVYAYIASLPASEQAQMAAYTEGMTEEQILEMFSQYIKAPETDATYEGNLRLLGVCNLEAPSSISIYTSTFEDKDEVERIIEEYNDDMREDDKEEYVIKYTDYVGLLMSSVSTIINFISYALIAFVSISLVVSSIMIGIITYISVLERTKEIGILRSIGASKKDISRVFNAETLIVGFVAGALGIGTTLLLSLPINIIFEHFTDVPNIVSLPIAGGVALIVISMALTLIAGLFPAKVAAKKDPVIALRSE